MSLVLGFDFNSEFKKIKRSAFNAVKDTFPIEGQKHKLIVKDVWMDDNLDFYDHREQKKTKLEKGTWAEPLWASLELIDKESGDTVDSVKKFKLFNLPKITSRFSYLIDGNEYQTINQMRLKSGVYSRVKANNQLESQFNLAKGINFKLILNQETESFYINIGTSNIRLLPILVDLGMSSNDIESAWGKKLFESNAKSSKGVMQSEIMKLYNKLLRKDAESRAEAVVGVSEYFSGRTEVSKDVTKRNLGTAFSKVTPELLLSASKKLLNVAKGTEKPDDRDSLVAKELHSIEDFIYERLDKNKDKMERGIKRNIDKRSKIREIVSLDTFNDPIKTLFTGTSLASTPEQINPVDMLSNKWEVTIMGEGGITNDRQITSRARAVHPTHFGFMDPFQTPESSAVGATLQMTLTSAKDGNDLKTTVYDMRSKGHPLIQMTPEQVFDEYTAFPDEYTVKNDKLTPNSKSKVKCMFKGEPVIVEASKVKYVLASTKGLLGMPANLVPFVNSDEGARVLMATKMLRQALPLKNREEQLVQTSTGSNVTFNEGIGKSFNAIAALDGEVSKIEDNSILIKGKDGKEYDHQIYDNFPLNQNTFLHEKPILSVGDKVKKGQVLTDSNYTKKGNLALGTNLRAAYIPMKGYSFEDSIVISETAAKKLTSEHIRKYTQRIDAATIMDLKKFNAYYPGEVLPGQGQKLDSNGVIKKGESVDTGDILIAALVRTEINPEDEMLSRISKSLIKPYKNKSQAWEYEFRGTVTDVVKTKKRIDVYIKTEEPAVIGDKLSGIHGNKGTIGLIMSDVDMPRTKDGRALDVALNPHGIPSRKNPGQVLETIASKIAEKTGKPYIVDNFEDKNYYKKVKEDAKKAGVKETEALFDPQTGQKLGDVMVGKQYILKLNHMSQKKFSARSYGEGYTAEMQPARGGKKGAQSMDALTINSLLAHGAKNILRETHSIKSEKNDEYWRALQLGMPLPPPKTSFIYDKFVNYLKATGIDVSKNGSKIQLLPLTNDQVDDMANGEVENISIVRGKNLKAEKGGLFDPKIFGGVTGSKWGKITLTEPIPNPVFENAIKAITGLKKSEYEGIVNGSIFIGKDGKISEDDKGVTGGTAIKSILDKIDLNKELKSLKAKSKTAKKTELNGINKKLRYLSALKRLNRTPSDYVLTKIPVIPPKFRPIYQLPDGNPIVSDLNELYKGVKVISDQLKTSEIPEYDKSNLRKDMYKSVKALFGLGQSLTKPDLRGTILELKGDNPKFGLIQQRMIKRRQDLTARSVIGPGPSYGIDEIGIPEKMAWSLYKPFIVKRMVRSGYSPLDAQQKIEDKHPTAMTALSKEVEARPVMVNRAPTLHKFGIMAFKPRVIQGKSIRMPLLPFKGFNLDLDGDTMSVHVPITEEGKAEAIKMLPSNHLLNPGTGKLMLVPSMEAVLGLYLLTEKGKTKKLKFKTVLDARQAIRDGRLGVTDTVEVNGIKTSTGRYLANEILPKGMRDYSKVIDKKELVKILEKVKDNHAKDYGKIADGLKDLGNKHSYYSGFSMRLEDIEPLTAERDKILKVAIAAIEKFKKTKPLKKALNKKVIEEYTKATDKMKVMMVDKLRAKGNAFSKMMDSGSKGGTNDAMQITVAPMLLVDSESKTIPIPVTKSYAEGLSTSDMWIQSYAARKGVIDRSRETADPGELSKMLASSMMGNTITVNDCGTKLGIKLSTSDDNILDRFSAEDISGVVKYNEVITSKVMAKAKARKILKIKVRSPLKCEAGKGTCAKCSGLDVNGKEYEIGDNIGVMSAQTISEPATQLVMRTFHTGGTAQSGAGGIVGSFERLKQVLTMPQSLPNKATLSSKDGEVKSIEKSSIGGHDVYVGNQKHHVRAGYDLKVKKGDKVKSGDVLSSGVIKPQELLEYKGLDATQKYMTDELYDLYSDGAPINRRVMEQVIKAITSLTKIVQPGSTNYIGGDIAPINKINALNKTLGKNDKIIHEPVLKGINMLPSAMTSAEDSDWMGRLGYRYIKKTLEEGASQGWTSDIHGNHPVPGLMYAKEFGKGEKGKY